MIPSQGWSLDVGGYHHQNQKPASETFFRVRINEFFALSTECRWNWDILDFK